METSIKSATAARVDFLGIGAQKAATTWLFEQLSQHPRIGFPAGKELHFWDNREGRPPEAWLVPFVGAESDVLQGEITPGYALLSEPVIAEIRRLCPNVRVFYCVRNPIDRAWSSALMAMQRAELEGDEVSDAWFLDHFRSRGSLGRGDHEAVLRRWRGVFGQEPVSAVLYDDLISDPAGVLRSLAGHIGVSPEPFSSRPPEELGRRVFAGSDQPLRASLRPALHELYAARIDSLGHYLDRDLSCWLGAVP